MRRSFNFSVLIALITLMLLSCATFKNQISDGKGNFEQARLSVISDLNNTYKTPRRYLKKRNGEPFNVFIFVREKTLDECTYLFSILPITENISIRIEDKLGEVPRPYFPNNYLVKDDKLFLWNDAETLLQKDILDTMNKFGVLDSTDIKLELKLLPEDFEDTRMIIIDDRLESQNYFICKNNIFKFKKVVTWKAFGYYKPPKLIAIKCFQEHRQPER